jgi:hypothetical protein
VRVTFYDCPWCGSAESIEHGLCQVCLMEFPIETKVIVLPTTRRTTETIHIVKPEAAGAE